MKNDSNFRLKINKPCSEDWQGMRIGINSRHCSNCNKSVIDFTKKSKEEILKHLKSNTNKSICGKLTNKQIDFKLNYEELIIRNEHSNFLKFPIYALAIGSLLTISSCDNSSKNKIQNIENINTKAKDYLNNDTIRHSKKTCKINNDHNDEEIDEIMGDISVDFVDKEPFHHVDKLPEFIGGHEKLKTYLKSKISSDTLNGKAYCNFVVDKFGKIKNIRVRVRSSSGKNLEKKLTNILKSMPNWRPGEKDGKIVESVYLLPIILK